MGFLIGVFLIIAYAVLLFFLASIACGILASIILFLSWLFRKFRPRKPVPFNPDVIPKVPEPRNLLGG